MNQSKACTKCRQTKSFSDFPKRTLSKNGLAPKCKTCASTYRAAYFQDNKAAQTLKNKEWRKNNIDHLKSYRQTNAEAITAKAKEWAKKNPEKIAAQNRAYQGANRKSISANKKAYYQANLEESRAYRQVNKEKLAAQNKEWRKAHPENISLIRQRRRALGLSNDVFRVTPKEMGRLYALPCAYCGFPSKHVDHVIPVSRGGTHGIGNLTGACASCNLSKGSKLITEWKKVRGW
jgi:5-methylcytosine-specific restriction endonuclease McrA